MIDLMATESVRTHDAMTLVAIGVAAHSVADVTHEVVGHGGICLLTGGNIMLLTAVYFRNEPLARVLSLLRF